MTATPGTRLADALITASLDGNDAHMLAALHGSELSTLVGACIYLAKSHARPWADICEHQGEDPAAEWRDALLEREAR